MNQFIIENPVFSIVIAFIIGAVIMNITSVLAVRMAVEKEVERALGDEGVEEETRAPGNVQEEEDTKEPWAREREKLWKEITENRESSALPEQDEEEEAREVMERQREELRKEIMENLAPPATPEQESEINENSEILHVMLGIDEDGCRCLYLAMPELYNKGEGPLAELNHAYYYHPTLQFLVDDFDLDKLAELGIMIRPEGDYVPMSVIWFSLKNDKVLKFLEEAFNACGKAIARE